MNTPYLQVGVIAVATIIVSAGCGAFDKAVVIPKPVSVSVAPAMGTGPFTAQVEVSAHSQEGTIRCQTGNSDLDRFDTVSPPSQTNTTYPLTFTPSRPGANYLVCWNLAGERFEDAVQSNAFTVPFTGTTTVTAYNVDGSQGCDVQGRATLIVPGDGTADFTATAPMVFDHTLCTQSSEESWIMDGTDDPNSGTVTITSCNSGRFQGTGQITYTQGKLAGTASCSKDGATWARVTLNG